MQPSVKKTVCFAGVSKANWIKCQQYFWQYYPLFPTCILLWQPAQRCFVLLRVMKAGKSTYLCLVCYSYSLNTSTYLTGAPIFLFLEQTAQFSLLKMRSQNSNIRLANRKAASLPPPPPLPKFSVHLIRWKLLPDHRLALSLTLNVCGMCSNRQQFSCYWKKHNCLQPKISSVAMSCLQCPARGAGLRCIYRPRALIMVTAAQFLALIIQEYYRKLRQKRYQRKSALKHITSCAEA